MAPRFTVTNFFLSTTPKHHRIFKTGMLDFYLKFKQFSDVHYLNMPNSISTSPLINPGDIPLKTKHAVIIDARSGPDAYSRYRTNHLEGAIHADLDRDLSKKPVDPSYGGRHPLPALQDFGDFLGKLGITPSSHVIVYDDKGGANAAARFWWMLRAIGHAKVHVVNGGLDAIVRDGLPLTSSAQQPDSTTSYPVQEWKWPMANLDGVKIASDDPETIIVDVREAYRYRGEREPIDLIAGHIPGAVNVPYLNNLTEEGVFRSAKELASQYNAALDGRDAGKMIVHCGSGVTACHTLLALEEAGIKGASLYVGSWGEWSRRDLPIATGSQ
jgi:thiosulfate/3-mercaptopyruvate sulfurtransferase